VWAGSFLVYIDLPHLFEAPLSSAGTFLDFFPPPGALFFGFFGPMPSWWDRVGGGVVQLLLGPVLSSLVSLVARAVFAVPAFFFRS